MCHDRSFVVSDSGTLSAVRNQQFGICRGCRLPKFLFRNSNGNVVNRRPLHVPGAHAECSAAAFWSGSWRALTMLFC
eukprot:525008-Pyramimonas_sp.AAC.1